MTVRVLVVDDEPDVEMLFRQQFRREDARGTRPCDLSLDDASGEKIILLVSDINMPGMSGLDLLPIVKTHHPDLQCFDLSLWRRGYGVHCAGARR